jgi:hypothetical protein
LRGSGGGGGSGAGRLFGIGRSDTADEAFDKMDVDKSGSLDVWELAQALKTAALIGGNRFGTRSRETLTELASRLVRMYDVDGDGVVDRQEYQTMVQDMAALRHARLREEGLEERGEPGPEERGARDVEVGRRRGWLSFVFGGRGEEASSDDSNTAAPIGDDAAGARDDEGIWDSVDDGEGSIVLEGLNVDLRRLLFGAIPGVKKVRRFVHEGMRSRSISFLSSS